MTQVKISEATKVYLKAEYPDIMSEDSENEESKFENVVGRSSRVAIRKIVRP